MTERIRITSENLDRRMKLLSQWNVPESTRKEVARFLHDLELGKVNRGKRISVRRRLKYFATLRVALEFLHKPTPRFTLRDLERLEQALVSGDLGSRRSGQAYRHNTQVDLRRLLKIFLRWRLGQTKALELAGWMDTRARAKTPEFLTEQEVEKLYRACSKPEQRFLIAMLFDSGARAEEFHNIRFEDVQLPEGKDNFARITLKEEYSKTLGRTIALYWRHSAEAIREYLQERRLQRVDPTDPVFPKRYPTTRKFLLRLGQRVLNRNLHYHLFRHSSATYYATKLNRQELCYRYGWRFSSNMPDIYISRAGMATRQLDEKFTQTELGEVKSELATLEQTTRIKDQRIHDLERSMRQLQDNVEAVTKVLSLRPTAEQVEAALARKRKRVEDNPALTIDDSDPN